MVDTFTVVLDLEFLPDLLKFGRRRYFIHSSICKIDTGHSKYHGSFEIGHVQYHDTTEAMASIMLETALLTLIDTTLDMANVIELEAGSQVSSGIPNWSWPE